MQSDYMIRVEAITQFTLAEFDKITNITRKNVDKQGMLFVGDTFECSKEMAEYLTGKNERGNVVVKVIEVIPEKVVEKEEIKKETEKSIKKKISKK